MITNEVEEKLWRDGCLGGDSPQQLLDTLVYGFGMNFALRSGKEHRSMRPDMLQLVEPSGSVSYLIYT